MPLASLDAFADHGDVVASLGADADPAEHLLEELARTESNLTPSPTSSNVRASSPFASHIARC